MLSRVFRRVQLSRYTPRFAVLQSRFFSSAFTETESLAKFWNGTASSISSLTIPEGSKSVHPDEIDLVLYHGTGCLDGLAAAFAAWKRLGDKAQYIPMHHDHRSNPPDVKGKTVAVLDFCFDKVALEKVKAEAKKVIVIEHHVSIYPTLTSVLPPDDYVYSDRQSGATLSWNFFHGVDVPHYFRFIEDRDLWRHALTGADAFGAGVRKLGFDFKILDNLLVEGISGIERTIEEGKPVQDALNAICSSTAQRAVPCFLNDFPDIPAYVVNASNFVSDVGHRILTERKTNLSIVWFHNAVTMTTAVSLRSNTDLIDSSEIAKHYGGGGHKRAAGFSIPNPSFIFDIISFSKPKKAPNLKDLPWKNVRESSANAPRYKPNVSGGTPYARGNSIHGSKGSKMNKVSHRRESQATNQQQDISEKDATSSTTSVGDRPLRKGSVSGSTEGMRVKPRVNMGVLSFEELAPILQDRTRNASSNQVEDSTRQNTDLSSATSLGRSTPSNGKTDQQFTHKSGFYGTSKSSNSFSKDRYSKKKF